MQNSNYARRLAERAARATAALVAAADERDAPAELETINNRIDYLNELEPTADNETRLRWALQDRAYARRSARLAKRVAA